MKKFIGLCFCSALAIAFVAEAQYTGQDTKSQAGYIEDLGDQSPSNQPATSMSEDKGGPTGSGIMYIRESIPEIGYPSFEGKSYERLVPDTLDLAERCRLALRGITNVVDPVCDYEAYCWVGNMYAGKVILRHSYHDYNGSQQKWIENLPLLRNATGDSENISVDRRMMEVLFHMLGPDGLYYIPVVGSPWAPYVPEGDYYADTKARQIVNSWPIGRALMALCCWYQRDPNPVFKEAIENMVDGLNQMAVHKDDFCYFLERKFDDRLPTQSMPVTSGASISQSTIMSGLANAYQTTHYEPARELGEKLARFIMGPSRMFDEEGRFTQVHFHGTTFALMGILDLGLATGDQSKIDFAHKAYEHARSLGKVRLGWFPEALPVSHPNVETCQVADMTIYAIKLSRAGLGDYWEDVEYYVRNQLQSNQVTDWWWLERVAEQNPGDQPLRPPYENADNVARRMVGTFNGMASIDGKFQPVSSGCCTGNGPRALWFAWRHTLVSDKEVLRVNLLLNRASKWADIDSYLPYQGKVAIKMKADKRLEVRIPSWVQEPSAIRCSVDANVRQCALKERYLQVGPVKAGQEVVVEFPLPEETFEVEIEYTPHESGGSAERSPEPQKKSYTVRMRGFNAVDLWPRRESILDANYQREDWRGNTPRFVKLTRFAPKEEIDW